MRITLLFFLGLSCTSLQAQTQTFVQGTISPGSIVRYGVRTSPLGVTSTNGQVTAIDNGVSRSVIHTGPLGYSQETDGTIIYGDGVTQRELSRTGSYGSATANSIYTQSANGIVIDGTRETVNGNTITSSGTIVYDDGSINRDVTRTGSNGNTVNASGTISQTNQGWARSLERQYPNSSASVESEIFRGNAGYDRFTNRSFANGQTAQGSASVRFGNGQSSGYRSSQTSAGRGFVGQSSTFRSNGGYVRSGSRTSNFGSSRGVRRVRRGR